MLVSLSSQESLKNSEPMEVKELAQSLFSCHKYTRWLPSQMRPVALATLSLAGFRLPAFSVRAPRSLLYTHFRLKEQEREDPSDGHSSHKSGKLLAFPHYTSFPA